MSYSFTSNKCPAGGLPYARLRMSDIAVVGAGVGHIGGALFAGERGRTA